MFFRVAFREGELIASEHQLLATAKNACIMRNGRSNQCVDKSRIPIPLNANNNLADATSDDQQM
jgi:hypothetical protein